nr:hypothetical protein [Tanacetum cinerariifolium]
VHHGEPDLPPPPPVIDNTRQPQMSDMTALLNDLSYIPPNNEHNEPTQEDIGETSNEPTQDTRNEFEELYASANEELYPSCDYVTRLDFMAKFIYFKVKGYESIHACEHDCCLFRGDDNKDLDFYSVCNTSRWKDSNTQGKKVPKKVLRYFLIIPRLQHLYKSSHTAKEMIWHATGKCTKPGKMQHPVDGRAWKKFNTKDLDFAKEPRNVRLGLAADGFNPFGNLSQAYSMWPVILTTYNLPPWLCMKESSFMLTLLIPCLKSPGKDIDVYLRPLIEDLKVLWNRKGVETIDVASGQKFNMRAMVLWTINDFPARKALEGRSIRLWWMFSFERYMKKLKGYVRNKAKPEGSIVKGYVAEEALTFSFHYFRDVTMKFNRPDRNVDPPPPTYNDKDPKVSTTSKLFALACGPTWTPISINSCIVDGVRYVVHSRDERRTTQNSGICSPGPDREMYYDGQSMEVDAPLDIIDVVDEDDDIIDDEDALPHDLAILMMKTSSILMMMVLTKFILVKKKIDLELCRTVPRRAAGRLNTRDKTQNLSLKEITDTKGPVPIRFEVRDKQTLMPLGEHAAHWSSYIREVIRGVPLYHPSWLKVPKERKTTLIADIRTQFDLRPHMESPDWTEIYAGIQQHLQKAYNTNKAAFKAQHWVIDPTTRTYNVEKIRRARPQDITADEWDKYIQFWNDPRNIARAAQNQKTRKRARSYLDTDLGHLLAFEMRWQSSATQEYPSLIDTFFVAHTVNGEFLWDEDRLFVTTYEEMRRLEATGTYTNDEINRLARGGKQRGHILGVGRVLPARATASPSTPAYESTLNSLHKKVDFMVSLFKSDSKYSDMFPQFESGGASGSGRCGDDEESVDDRDDEDEDGDGDN